MTAVQATPTLARAAQRPAQSWLPALDGMRAVAALAVLVTHVSFRSGLTVGSAHVGPVLARLEFGVALFFVLSGYLLYRPFATAALQGLPGPRVRSYLWKRGLRVLPAYWLMIVVVLIAFNLEVMRDVWDWVVPLGLLQIYQPLWLPLGAEQTWSLATEATFYLALPVLALLARRLGGATRRARVRRQLLFIGFLIVFGLAWTISAHTSWWQLNILSVLWLPGYLDWFGVGMALAVVTATTDLTSRLQNTIRALASAPWTCWSIAALTLWIASTPIAGPLSVFPAPTASESIWKHVLYVAVAAFLILPLITGEPHRSAQAVLANPVARYLGKISYGVFLWHIAVMEAWYRITGTPEFSGGFWSLLAVTLLVSITAASFSYHLVEHPIQRLRR